MSSCRQCYSVTSSNKSLPTEQTGQTQSSGTSSQAVPAATFTVVGRDDAPMAASLSRVPGVRLTGYVDDITPYFEGARAVVVPLRSGGGMRVKILETFARGVPVVSTSIGVEGIDAVPGVHLLTADDASTFAH